VPRGDVTAAGGAVVLVQRPGAGAPRVSGKVPVAFYLRAGLEAAQRKKLERSALGCPVAHSLHPDLEQPVEFIYLD